MSKNIWLVDFTFKKRVSLHREEEIRVKDVIVSIGNKTPKAINEVLTNELYRSRALRKYLGDLGRVYKREDALRDYKPLKIDFTLRCGVTNF